MNMELYLTILETSVKHLDKLAVLLESQNATYHCREDAADAERIKGVLQEILLTANKLEVSTKSLIPYED